MADNGRSFWLLWDAVGAASSLNPLPNFDWAASNWKSEDDLEDQGALQNQRHGFWSVVMFVAVVMTVVAVLPVVNCLGVLCAWILSRPRLFAQAQFPRDLYGCFLFYMFSEFNISEFVGISVWETVSGHAVCVSTCIKHLLQRDFSLKHQPCISVLILEYLINKLVI